jgi:hypothetical protein
MNEGTNNIKTTISKPIDSSKRKGVLYGFSIAFALLIAFSLFLISKIPYINSAPFIILILFTFSISILNGMGIQTAICSNMNLKQISLNSLIPVIAVSLFYLLSKNIGLLQYPINAFLPNLSNDNKILVTLGFYTFWGALYGLLISGGFLQSCVSTVNVPSYSVEGGAVLPT